MSNDLIGVSIIMPTFEQDTLFKRAVQSIRDQSFQNIELIVVDDNIDIDKTNSIINYLDTITDLDIKYIKNHKNLGSSRSRNIGVEKAEYSYVTFLDDDDYYKNKKVENQLNQMINDDSDYSVCNIALQHPNGYQDKRRRSYLKNDESLLTKHLKYHITATSTFMFKKDFFMQIGGFPKSDLGDEFILMTESILNSEKISHCMETLVIATVNYEGGLSSNQNKIRSEENLIDYKSQYFDILGKDDVRYIKMRHYLVKSMTYYRMNKIMSAVRFGVFALLLSPLGIFKILRGIDR